MSHLSVMWVPCSYNIQNAKHYLIFLNIMRTSSFDFLLQENVPIAKLVGAGSLWPFTSAPKRP